MANEAIGPRPRIQIPGDLRVCGALSPRMYPNRGAASTSVPASSTLAVNSTNSSFVTLGPNEGILIEYASGQILTGDASGQLSILNAVLELILNPLAAPYIIPAFNQLIATSAAVIASFNVFAIVPFFLSYDDCLRFIALSAGPISSGTPITVTTQFFSTIKNNDGAAAHSAQAQFLIYGRLAQEVVEVG